MDLRDCSIGMIVEMKENVIESRIGYIVGLSVNSYNEVIPIVRFAGSNTENAVHHKNLRRL